MKTINIDDMAKEMFESIEVTIGGKVYIVDTVPATLIQRFIDLRGSEDLNKMYGVVAELIGANPDELAQLDMRKLGLLANNLIKAVMEQAEEVAGKNVPKGKPDHKQ